MALIDKYTKEELELIVKNSFSFAEVIQKLGYTTSSGSNHKTVYKRIEQYNISTKHFKTTKQRKLTESDIFVENSTVTRAVARRWYKKNNYTAYECSICGLKPFWQNKPLTLILDHINGKNNDHSFENLRWVCPNCNQQLETTNGKNRKILEKVNHCKNCGCIIQKKSTYCRKCCTQKIKKKKNEQTLKKYNLNRNELKNLIRTQSFTNIGKMFSVTDNMIRKLCDKFNLPRTKKEINSYSDEEWINI